MKSPNVSFSKGQDLLLDWFKTHARQFPWRNTRDPFKVLVAEKLLQQTAANAHVVKAYTALVEEFPTAKALGEASLEVVQEIVAPLGLKYRAEELVKMARELQGKHGGEVPSDLTDILRLTGVGQYCGRAVLCFAMQRDIPVVDTNIARFIKRYVGLTEVLPANPARSKKFLSLQAQLIPEGDSREYQLAILDLCASTCRPRNPRCSECPVREECSHGTSKNSAPLSTSVSIRTNLS
ncbi:MAG TPA: A/G-specific adenine glycosylase [Phycisphaerales bacterium]|nr:A/G-specific adenine glycosylase [Phycisphaerales bacterium]